MNAPRYSTRTLLLMVAAIAASIGLLRLGFDTGPGSGGLGLLGSFVLLNAVALAALRLAIRGRTWSPFLVGFVLGGLAAVVVGLPLVEAHQSGLGRAIVQTFQRFPPTGRLIFATQNGSISDAGRIGLIVLMVAALNVAVSGPMLAAAAAGGMLARGVHRLIGGRAQRPASAGGRP